MKRSRKLILRPSRFRALRLAGVLFLGIILLAKFARHWVHSQSGLTLVTRVIDGDTVEIESGEHVRYIGIDTPETVHPNKPVECFGPEATAANRSMVEGKTVRLERDVTNRDEYGRLLRYVHVGSTDVAAALIQMGYGYASFRQPDTKNLRSYAKLEIGAENSQKGLWQACLRD